MGLVLMGRAMFSKFIIQFSIDGWSCVPSLLCTWGLVAQMVKPLSTMWETWVRSLGSIPGLGSSLEKEMAIHSSTTAWKIPWTEEPGRLQSMGSQRVGHD